MKSAALLLSRSFAQSGHGFFLFAVIKQPCRPTELRSGDEARRDGCMRLETLRVTPALNVADAVAPLNHLDRRNCGDTIASTRRKT